MKPRFFALEAKGSRLLRKPCPLEGSVCILHRPSKSILLLQCPQVSFRSQCYRVSFNIFATCSTCAFSLLMQILFSLSLSISDCTLLRIPIGFAPENCFAFCEDRAALCHPRSPPPLPFRALIARSCVSTLTRGCVCTSRSLSKLSPMH